MTRLTDQQVEQVARELAGRLGERDLARAAGAGSPLALRPGRAAVRAPAAPLPIGGDGVFETLDQRVAAARRGLPGNCSGMSLAQARGDHRRLSARRCCAAGG